MNDLKTLLRAAREGAGMSQSELARRLKVTPSSVSQWEDGLTEPRPAKRHLLATILNQPKLAELQAAEVMEAEGEMIPPNKLPPEVARLVKPWVDKKCEIWLVETDMMARTDIKRGYYAVVAPGQTTANDLVLAIVDGKPVFRIFWPPYLVAMPDGPKPPDVLVDKLRVFVRGKVEWSFPPPRYGGG